THVSISARSGGWLVSNACMSVASLVLSVSKDELAGRLVVRQAHHERVSKPADHHHERVSKRADHHHERISKRADHHHERVSKLADHRYERVPKPANHRHGRVSKPDGHQSGPRPAFRTLCGSNVRFSASKSRCLSPCEPQTSMRDLSASDPRTMTTWPRTVDARSASIARACASSSPSIRTRPAPTAARPTRSTPCASSAYVVSGFSRTVPAPPAAVPAPPAAVPAPPAALKGCATCVRCATTASMFIGSQLTRTIAPRPFHSRCACSRHSARSESP